MFPRDFVQYSPLPLLSVKRKKTFPKLLSGLGNARGTGRNRRVYDFLTSGLPYLPHLVSKPSKQQKRVSLVLRRDRLKQKEKALVCMTHAMRNELP
jgi:hypothetical protein